MAQGTYAVRMQSGNVYQWTGDPVAAIPTNWNTVRGFLILADGTLVTVALIESFVPVTP
jgi:hypothetical protein